MNFKKLAELLFREIKLKLENNQGLSIFAKERAKFEGWLKVELCNILSSPKYFNYFNDIIPEKDRIDITFKNWAIELKTINTNIRYENVKNKTRPTTKNVQGVIKDIKKLKSRNYKNKAVLFIAFPINHDNKHWQIQFKKIAEELNKIKHSEFYFKKKIPGVIYCGLI